MDPIKVAQLEGSHPHPRRALGNGLRPPKRERRNAHVAEIVFQRLHENLLHRPVGVRRDASVAAPQPLQRRQERREVVPLLHHLANELRELGRVHAQVALDQHMLAEQQRQLGPPREQRAKGGQAWETKQGTVGKDSSFSLIACQRRPGLQAKSPQRAAGAKRIELR